MGCTGCARRAAPHPALCPCRAWLIAAITIPHVYLSLSAARLEERTNCVFWATWDEPLRMVALLAKMAVCVRANSAAQTSRQQAATAAGLSRSSVLSLRHRQPAQLLPQRQLGQCRALQRRRVAAAASGGDGGGGSSSPEEEQKQQLLQVQLRLLGQLIVR